MDRLSGLVDLAGATDDAERDRVARRSTSSCSRGSTRSRSTPPRPPASRCPPTPRPPSSRFLRRDGGRRTTAAMEGQPADPVEVFLRRWLRDHVPQDRLAAALLHHLRLVPVHVRRRPHHRPARLRARARRRPDDGPRRVAHPRHAQEPRRPRRRSRARYEAVTGVASTTTSSSTRPCCTTRCRSSRSGLPLADPVRGTDWISYLAWYVNGARWAFESIAEIRGYTLDTGRDPRRATDAPRARAPVPGRRPARRGRGRRPTTSCVGLGRIASHLKRVDEIGAAVRRRRPRRADRRCSATVPIPHDADAELVAYIEQASAEHEEALVRLLDARVQRHAPHHGVADLVDAPPSRAAQPPSRPRDRTARPTRAGPPARSPAPADPTARTGRRRTSRRDVRRF